jgi:hypothetical protein
LDFACGAMPLKRDFNDDFAFEIDDFTADLTSAIFFDAFSMISPQT